jgi:undecaprenyl diphosphate synthase
MAKPSIPPALADVPRPKWPGHVAIIMDGNGRWAQNQGLPRIEGHRRGGRVVRAITKEAARLGLKQLTLFAFSAENWQRPAEEVAFLVDMYRRYLVWQRPTILKNDIRFVTIGRRDGIPPAALAEADRTVRLSADNRGLVLCLAVNYGGRQEIADAARRIAARVARGDLRPEDITEETVAGALDTAGMPDPDLLIRTAGETRVSNFLLWQISYAEFWSSPKCWPDFTAADLHQAIRDYAGRQRRFGRLAPE